MGDIRDEALLHLRKVGELGDLLLQCGCHPVEGHSQAGDFVFADHSQTLVQLTVCDPLGDLGGLRDRFDHRPSHPGCDEHVHDENGRDRDEEDTEDEVHVLLHGGEVVDEEQAIRRARWQRNADSEGDAGHLSPIITLNADRLPMLTVRAADQHGLSQLFTDDIL